LLRQEWGDDVKELFSADEFKWSMIALCLLIFSALAVWAYVQFHQIEGSLVAVIQTLIGTLGGMNVFNKAATAVTSYMGNPASPVNPTPTAPRNSTDANSIPL
jgi:hypothetical protein